MVIERALFLSDTQVLWKAYLRRGLAHETLGRHEDAVHDLLRVAELQPGNNQANQAIQRCTQAIKDKDKEWEPPVYASAELAASKINPTQELPELEGVKPAEQSIEEAK
jgi:hypothetical protein